MVEKIAVIEKMTAAQIFINGTTLLGQCIIDNVKIAYDKNIETQAANKCNTNANYRVMLTNHDAVLALSISPTS